ncbi:MAG TPA: sigma-70 family RNA polymerase sigma factor [Ktedonobacterales bacterium]|nr:sigma-70 family RNA polymerase sigma factor [Ktedonobacterales bacterium]
MRMVWQDMAPFPTPRMDAEEERELRLAAQARAGAEWALAALIARYQPPVVRYLARLTGDAAQSHTMAQYIFVRMERRVRGPHGGEHLRLWLLRAATETGLDALRHPKRARQSRLNAPPGPRGLLMDGLSGSASDRLRAGLDKIAEITGSTRRQVRQLIWNSGESTAPDEKPRAQSNGAYGAHGASGATGAAKAAAEAVDPEIDTMTPREELRHRLIRAVLAELPYGDAQCLALHLVAGLNQTEVAAALGIRPSAARHRIVQGLQMFAHRYDAAITSLGVPAEIAYADDGQSLPAPTPDLMETMDVLNTTEQDYPVPMAPMDDEAYSASETEREAAFSGAYDLAESPVGDAPASPPPPPPSPTSMIVGALPAIIHDELSQDWVDQPTMVPILSARTSSATDDVNVDGAGEAPPAAQTPPSVPVLTPPPPQTP